MTGSSSTLPVKLRNILQKTNFFFFSETYIRSNFRWQRRPRGHQCVGVSSPSLGEGRTVYSILGFRAVDGTGWKVCVTAIHGRGIVLGRPSTGWGKIVFYSVGTCEPDRTRTWWDESQNGAKKREVFGMKTGPVSSCVLDRCWVRVSLYTGLRPDTSRGPNRPNRTGEVWRT